MEDELTTSTISRRKLLKRAGIGVAAVGWSAPFLTSTASARIKSGQSPACHANGQVACPDCGFCSFPCATKNGLVCGCAPAVNQGKPTGCCIGVGNFACDDPNAVPCNSTADCPPGWKCTINCCGQTCAAPCGQGLSCGGPVSSNVRTGGRG